MSEKIRGVKYEKITCDRYIHLRYAFAVYVLHGIQRLQRDIYGEKKCVNSAHVMAIDKLSPVLSVSATSADGVIEGVYNKKLNVYAVQFHPERLIRPARDRFYDYVLNN